MKVYYRSIGSCCFWVKIKLQKLIHSLDLLHARVKTINLFFINSVYFTKYIRSLLASLSQTQKEKENNKVNRLWIQTWNCGLVSQSFKTLCSRMGAYMKNLFKINVDICQFLVTWLFFHKCIKRENLIMFLPTKCL